MGIEYYYQADGSSGELANVIIPGTQPFIPGQEHIHGTSYEVIPFKPDEGRTASQARPGPKRVSLQLSNNLHREIKRIALEEDETLNSLIVRLLREFIADRQRTQRRPLHPRSHQQ
jgi:hypothetical protein